MTTRVTSEEALDRALLSLSGHGRSLVIVGGWALRLLAAHEQARRLDRELLVTTDLDVAVRSPDGLKGVDLGARLEEAGFVPRMWGDQTPPVMDYVTETTTGPFSVEFLAQRQGGSVVRGGTRNATRRLLGVVAQALPHLRPAFACTWTVEHRASTGAEGSSRLVECEVPNPVGYIVQKLISMSERRTPRERERDLLYVTDAMALFGDVLPRIAEESRGALLDALTRAERTEIRRRVRALGEVGDLHLGAARQAESAGMPDRADPEALASFCREGLARLGPLGVGSG